MALPRVVLLPTGGTIAGRFDPSAGGFVPALSADELVAMTPGLEELARIQVEPVSSIDSSQMSPAIWLRLLERVRARLEEPDVAGVVITHGTDTLEETAYFLDLSVDSAKPVVLAGAQRAPSYRDSDGPRNLRDAVRVAVSAEAAGKGALVVMNGQIHAARDVTKTHTLEAESFQSLEFGPLGVADVEGVRFYRAPLRRQHLRVAASARLPRVEIVIHYAGADGSVIRALHACGAPLEGLVVAATGAGNVSEGMYEAIRELREAGVPVVIGTRVYTGRVAPVYGGRGALRSLQELGCVVAGNLSPQKARVLLMLALAGTTETGRLQEYFGR